ncbi:SDR family oxidoreductase [Caldivirga sp. UBA161]|uniref:SDR family oxidoreductase n=1 Tax=Caldivirga sp. UBA161 TaxID=1915569 RepID=UPI0025BB3484|nr:SDR family oxidoreductase [Caldivirga sp. UBA161]
MVDLIKGKTALVTGGSSRLGKVICNYLAREGVNVVIHYNSSREEALRVKEEITSLGVKSWVIKADLSKPNEVDELINESFKQAGEVNFLINNASVFPRVGLSDLSINGLNWIMQVNAWAPLMLTLRFANMVNEGKVINVLDSVVDGYNFERYAYYLSKVMLNAVTRSLALRLAPRIMVNAVAPGIILPAKDEDTGRVEAMINQVPLRRRGSPDDIAHAVLFLLENSYVTGQVIYVDGGEHLKPRVVY